MEDWQKQIERYADQGRLHEKADEDLVAGRILRGFGLTHAKKKVYDLESRLFGCTYGERPLWQRACHIFMWMAGQTTYRSYVRRWDPQAIGLKNRAEALERLTLAEEYELGQWPLLFTREQGTTNSSVYTIWLPEELGQVLQPPFTVLACEELPQHRVVMQETSHFVKQFGPYPIEHTE